MNAFNEKCAQKLKQLRFDERVAVIGSGPSRPFVATIESLVKSLQQNCHARKGRDEPHWEFFERAHKKSKKNYFKTIKESFQELSEGDARVYQYLVKIHFKSFVTLNFDDQLPRAFLKNLDDKDGLFSVFPGNDKFHQPSELTGPKQNLVAIHG